MPSGLKRVNNQILLDALKLALTSRLPSSWSVEVYAEPKTSGARSAPDAMLTIRAPDGRTATVPVEVRQRLDPKDVAPLAAQIRQMMGPDSAGQPVVVAPYLSRRTQDLLTQGGISYATGGSLLYGLTGGTSVPTGRGPASTSGTISVQLTDPALYISDVQTERNLWVSPREQPLRSLRGGVAGRVVRALCDIRPPYGVQDLAERSATPIASVSRVLGLLDREALITRMPGGAVTAVQWADVIHRWTQDYTFAKANAIATYLEPRGLGALLDKLRHTDLPYAVTGSMAASVLAPVAAPRLLTIYVVQREIAADTWGLRQAERGANVLLAEPYNPVVFDRMQLREGIKYASASQVAADLLTGSGRSPSEGDALIQWMQEHEDAWRS